MVDRRPFVTFTTQLNITHYRTNCDYLQLCYISDLYRLLSHEFCFAIHHVRQLADLQQPRKLYVGHMSIFVVKAFADFFTNTIIDFPILPTIV